MSAPQSLPGIGPVLTARLADAGIQTAEQLREMGVKNAFMALKAAYPDACLSSLYGLACGIKGMPRGSLSADDKAALKSFFRSL